MRQIQAMPAFDVAKAARPGIFVGSAARASFSETTCKMALHRDIFWVGRQWAVTGCGMQAVDQKLKGKVDIDAIRLWEDGLLESVRAEPWLNIEDFEKALSVARKHFPEPARKAPPPEERVLALIEAISKEAAAEKVAYRKTGLKECSVEPPALPTFDMSIEGWPAKFVPPWRIRIKR